MNAIPHYDISLLRAEAQILAEYLDANIRLPIERRTNPLMIAQRANLLTRLGNEAFALYNQTRNQRPS
jgi:hypothetical protein